LKKKVLVTGGFGFVGSHTTVKLLEKNHEVIILDNLSNSDYEVNNRIKCLVNKEFQFIKGDVRDKDLLEKIFKQNPIDIVIHFAGLKAAGESEENPLNYYDNNVSGSLTLFKEMQAANIKSIIFSSSASIYGNSKFIKCSEDSPLEPLSVYGKTKLIIEEILKKLHASDSEWKVINLRYFNPIGAHPTGLIGEDPKEIPTNLLPFITDVAFDGNKQLLIFGDNYQTSDGTGKRDYIHVEDLALGHLAALEKLFYEKSICTDINLGTGKAYSVMEVIRTFERISGRKIPYKVTDRRKGDISEICADPSYAKTFLKWQAKYDLDKMCLDAWRWKKNNPNGYV
jgi:UDP-glucose 4-epimerase